MMILKNGLSTGEGYESFEETVSKAINMAGEDVKEIQRTGKRATVESIFQDGQMMIRVVDSKVVRSRYTFQQ